MSENHENLKPKPVEKQQSENRAIPIFLSDDGQAAIIIEKLSGSGYIAENNIKGGKYGIDADEDIEKVMSNLMKDVSNATRNAFIKNPDMNQLEIVVSVAPYEGQPQGHRVASAHRALTNDQRFKVHDTENKHVEKGFRFDIGTVNKDEGLQYDDKNYRDGHEIINHEDDISENEIINEDDEHISGRQPKADVKKTQKNSKENVK